MAHFLQPENKDSGQYNFCNSCIVIKTDAINKHAVTWTTTNLRLHF